MNSNILARRLRPACVFLLAAAAASVGGCGGKPAVSGTVTYKSAPLSTGEVSFVSGSGSRSGLISAGGRYEIADPPEGEVTVIVTSTKIETKAGGPGSPLGGAAKFEDIKSGVAKSLIPTKYNDVKTSPLRYTVGSGKQTNNIALED
jgi:hypothetical protein